MLLDSPGFMMLRSLVYISVGIVLFSCHKIKTESIREIKYVSFGMEGETTISVSSEQIKIDVSYYNFKLDTVLPAGKKWNTILVLCEHIDIENISELEGRGTGLCSIDAAEYGSLEFFVSDTTYKSNFESGNPHISLEKLETYLVDSIYKPISTGSKTIR